VLSSAVDITGVLAASTMAVLGFFVIPYKRKQAKDNFRVKMQTLRAKLVEALTKQFKEEREMVIARLKDGVAPYTRYINSELERIDTAESTLADLKQKLSALRARAQTVLK
jgi:sigma54-dependent transcription regulator